MSAIRTWQLLSLALFLALAASTAVLGTLYYRAWLRPAAVVEGRTIPVRALYGRLLDRYGRDELAKMATEIYTPLAAAKAKVTAEQREIDDKIAALKARSGSEEEFERFVRYGLRMNPAELRSQVRLAILSEKFMLASTPITDEEVQEYWVRHKEEFRQPERFRVLKMTLGSYEEATKVREQLLNGADFSQIAAERSVDPYTKTTRGRLPAPMPLTEFSTDPRYNEVFAGLKPEEVTPPMQGNFGVMLVKLLERVPPHEPDYEADRVEARERAIRAKIGDPNAWMLKRLREANVSSPLWGDEWLREPAPDAPAPGIGY